MFKRTGIFDYYLSYAGALIAVAALIAYLAATANRIEPVPPIRPNTYQCNIDNGAHGRSLQILTYSEAQARILVDRLCQADIVRSEYEEVHATWHRRRIDEHRLAFDQRFDLLATRPGPMERRQDLIVNAYVPIAGYASNTSRFISLSDQPELSQQYFQSRRLGLIEMPESLSGHVIPRRQMLNAGVDESSVTIRYYDDHIELYRALIDHEVDVIATGLPLPSEDVAATSHFTLPMQSGVAGPKWYLHPRLADTRMHCLISSVLVDLAETASLAYEHSLQLLRECER